MSEDPNIIQNQGSPVSFLSSNDGEIRENIDPNIGVPNIEYSDIEGAEILRPVRPSQVSRTISESSTDSSMMRMKMIGKKKATLLWEPVRKPDIDAFLGIIILMGIHVLPSIDLYWSTGPFFRVDEIAQVMTCKRFKKFLENLHLNDKPKAPAKTSN
ncbi:unnamed protein product [Parnassius apollo]|uniref:(apollo) hypothetical protein n=1 Tax=Parnassius apollo TaxID=110799 RepID=A0A8S3XQ13_PARAO|nr:unnamed protein product [Parnassius apollo]